MAVLLYYKYLDLGESGREVCTAWFEASCRAAGLRGRVRVALDGVNATLGGNVGTLQEHIAAVKAHPILQGDDIDFKLSVSQGALNQEASAESGFRTLAVNAVKEVYDLFDDLIVCCTNELQLSC
jgi:predicted sulfurtransferase